MCPAPAQSARALFSVADGDDGRLLRPSTSSRCSTGSARSSRSTRGCARTPTPRGGLEDVARGARPALPRSSRSRRSRGRARAGFGGLALLRATTPPPRVIGRVVPADGAAASTIATSTGTPYRFRRFARPPASRSPATSSSCRLYWLEGYGGGLFLPFADATSGDDDLRRRPLPARHGQGRRPRHAPTAGSCSTSTSPTTRRAPTTRRGRARWPRPRTASLSSPGRRAHLRLSGAAPPAGAGPVSWRLCRCTDSPTTCPSCATPCSSPRSTAGSTPPRRPPARVGQVAGGRGDRRDVRSRRRLRLPLPPARARRPGRAPVRAARGRSSRSTTRASAAATS